VRLDLIRGGCARVTAKRGGCARVTAKRGAAGARDSEARRG
jgi:hypothetical protein